MSEIYEGRLVCDGYGNLLAGEGEHEGKPVAFHEGSYVFVKKGEQSHNERHHKNFAGVVGTQTDDPNLPGYAGTADKPTKGNEHHFGVLSDDAHAKGLKFDADKLAEVVTGHTAAYTGGSDE